MYAAYTIAHLYDMYIAAAPCALNAHVREPAGAPVPWYGTRLLPSLRGKEVMWPSLEPISSQASHITWLTSGASD